jgi:hypothetical protein
MPTVYFKFGYRFYFVSFDCSEPPHIHVGDDKRKICKFWLKNSVAVLADNAGFTKKDINLIEKDITANYTTILKTFNDFCKGYKK